MKKTVLLISAVLFSLISQAQSVSLLGYGGALTGSRVFPLGNESRVTGDWCYGAGLEFGLDFGAVTLTWTGSKSDFENYGILSSSKQETPIATNYYQLGFEKNLTEGTVTPHTIFTLGAAQFTPEDKSASGDKWFFAATFGVGLKAEVNEKVAIRIQAKGNMPLEMGGAGIFCGYGGCAPNVYFNPIVFQGEFTAGLALKIK